MLPLENKYEKINKVNNKTVKIIYFTSILISFIFLYFLYSLTGNVKRIKINIKNDIIIKKSNDIKIPDKTHEKIENKIKGNILFTEEELKSKRDEVKEVKNNS
jgi:cell division protein FtsX